MSMTVIEHIEVGSGGAASIVFDEIPATYTDLYLAISGRNSANNVIGYMDINGASTNRTYRILYGYNGSAATSSGTSSETFFVVPSSGAANIFSSSSVYIPNYAGSTNKSISVDSVTEWNGPFAWTTIRAGLWSATDAITSLTLTLASGNFVQYSSATLYGITAGSDGTTTVS